MRKIHTVLRLHFESGLSRREIAKSQSISYGTVANYLHRAKTAGLNWPLSANLSERELTAALFPERTTVNAQKRFLEPDYPRIHLELKSVGMTKLLAWEEYRQTHPDNGYSYSQFCHRYLVWLQRQQRSMRQTHIAGEKVFIDYCGPTIPIVNQHTGEFINAQIFVAALGASNYTFACASASQKEADWIEAHVKAAEFYGGWSKLTIPDNLKSGVTKTHRYVPVLNASYEQWADHYSTAIIPARPYKPKDKAKAENAVLVVERWILARQSSHSTLKEHMPHSQIKNNPFAASWRCCHWPNNMTVFGSNGPALARLESVLPPEPAYSRFLKTVSTPYPPKYKRSSSMTMNI